MPQPKQKPWQTRKSHVDGTRIVHDEVCWNEIFSIPHFSWSPTDPLSLPFIFFPSHGVAFEIMHSPTWSFQRKMLSSWKVLGPVVVAQDLVYSICYDRKIFLEKAAVKKTGFPGCVHWPSKKEAAQLIRPPHLLHLICPLWMDSSSGLTPYSFIATGVNCLKSVGHSTHVTSSVPCARHDPKGQLTLWTIKHQTNDEHTHRGTYVAGTATIFTHEWVQNLCFSAHIDRHNVTNWCTVALIGVTSGSLLKCSETTNTRNEEQSWNDTKKNQHPKWFLEWSKASAKNSRLRSRLVLARGTGTVPEKGIKRCVTTARRRLNWNRASASVGMSSQPQKIVAASLTPMKYQPYAKIPNIAETIWNIVTNLMHSPWKDSFQAWVLQCRMSHSQSQIHFRNHPEHKQR